MNISFIHLLILYLCCFYFWLSMKMLLLKTYNIQVIFTGHSVSISLLGIGLKMNYCHVVIYVLIFGRLQTISKIAVQFYNYQPATYDDCFSLHIL